MEDGIKRAFVHEDNEIVCAFKNLCDDLHNPDEV